MKQFGTTQRRRQSNLPYVSRRVLLTKGELAFYRSLRAATSGLYLLLFKVRVADLIECPADAWQDGFGHMIARHHIDFVLCDRQTTEIRAAIELDDKSHSKQSRKRRDQFLTEAFIAAHIPLLRFRAAARYDVKEITARLYELS